MKYIQLVQGVTPKAIVMVPPKEMRLDNLIRNYLSHVPKEVRNDVCFACFTTETTIEGQEEALRKIPLSVVVSVCDLALYKRISGNGKLPKCVGNISTTDQDGRMIQYCAYSSKALYLASQLEHNEKCAQHVSHYLANGKLLKTMLPRLKNFPKTQHQVRQAFKYLLTMPLLGADIETTSLKFYKAKLVSISIAIDEQRGFTFHVKNCAFIEQLKAFFRAYTGRIAWHGGAYDLKTLAYMLFNSDSRVLYKSYEDTLLLHYLCTNSPERMPRDLGTLTSDLCGEYKLTKQEITNMMDVDVTKVCNYNLDDSRGTIWLYNTLRPLIHNESLYQRFKDRQWYLTQTELCGLPVSMKRLEEVEIQTAEVIEEATATFMANPNIVNAAARIKEIDLMKANAKRVKQLDIWEYPDVDFNPNSSAHLSVLFFDIMQLKPTKKTKSGKPSTDAVALVKLKHQANAQDKPLFDALDDLNKSSKLAGVFLKAVRENSVERNGWYYLHGSYNLGKVVSSRLSSSDPNLNVHVTACYMRAS